MTSPPCEPALVSEALIAWYGHMARKLPWRQTHDPYAIWVSEVMLQQTQVITVLPYYQRFLTAFPTVKVLAEASLDAVLKLWEGLGYYARCRNLHKAAQMIMNRHQGRFPDTFEEVLALPGIGESTAGAILTFAHRQAHPILDGNVKRVLARLYAVNTSVQQPATLRQLWQHSRELVLHSTDVYSLNQALMELGATHCSQSSPQCLLCPLSAMCQARLQGLESTLPVKAIRAATPHYDIGAAVIWRHSSKNVWQVYIQQRPADGLLGGLWEFPGGKREAEDASLAETALREVREELGITVKLGSAYPPIRHAYTHFRITLHAFEAYWQSGSIQSPLLWQWLPVDALGQYAFPKANQPILTALMAQAGKPSMQPG